MSHWLSVMTRNTQEGEGFYCPRTHCVGEPGRPSNHHVCTAYLGRPYTLPKHRLLHCDGASNATAASMFIS